MRGCWRGSGTLTGLMTDGRLHALAEPGDDLPVRGRGGCNLALRKELGHVGMVVHPAGLRAAGLVHVRQDGSRLVRGVKGVRSMNDPFDILLGVIGLALLCVYNGLWLDSDPWLIYLCAVCGLSLWAFGAFD